MSCRYREQTPLEMKMDQPSENVNVVRVAVSSIAWLDVWVCQDKSTPLRFRVCYRPLSLRASTTYANKCVAMGRRWHLDAIDARVGCEKPSVRKMASLRSMKRVILWRL